MTPGAPDPDADLQALSDTGLVTRLVTAREGSAEQQDLAAELARRAAHPAHRGQLRRALEGYTHAAAEYIDEDTQATARLYLARLSAELGTHG